jgi:hypothetical protein
MARRPGRGRCYGVAAVGVVVVVAVAAGVGTAGKPPPRVVRTCIETSV